MSRVRPDFGPRQIKAVEELRAKRHYLLIDLFGRLTLTLVRLRNQPVKRKGHWFVAIQEVLSTSACTCSRLLSLEDCSVCADPEGEWNDAQCLMTVDVNEAALAHPRDAAKLLSESERTHLERLVIAVETLPEAGVEVEIDLQQL